MQKPITVAIYFNEPEKYDSTFGKKIYYESYCDFTALCKEHGITVYIVRGNTYLGNMQFKEGYQFVGTEFLDVNQVITADVILMREQAFSFQAEPSALVINYPEFERLAKDKWRVYELLKDFMAKTEPISEENWREVVARIPGETVVLKPVTGDGGKGVLILKKDEVDFPALQLKDPYIAQEFIDCSAGIPGVMTGYHDLRLILFDGEVRLSYIRRPKPGSLLSNLSQGGSIETIPLEKVPQQAIDMALAVDKNFLQYIPRVYTVDFMFQGERPYVVELNPRPGFPNAINEGVEFTAKFHQYFMELLQKAVEQVKSVDK